MLDYETSRAYSVEERLVLRLADRMSKTPATIDEGLFRDLQAHFTEQQIVELSATISWEHFRSRFNRVFAIESAGFAE